MQTLAPLNVPELLRRHGLRPSKGLGQNFLVDESALQRIVAAAEIQADEHVLEIGPGVGSLTRWLAQTAQSVTTVELDSALIPLLREAAAPYRNIHIVQGDILSLNLSELMQNADRYQVVANIPYYITAQIIRHLLETKPPPYRMVLTVQEEVAQRICAPAGALSLLALSVQVYGQPQIVAHIPAGAFYPPPRVDSAVIRVDLFPDPAIPAMQLPLFFQLARAGFSQKRKTLRNALAGGMRWKTSQAQAILKAADIDPQRRAETLNLGEWQRLIEIVASFSPPQE